MPDKRTHRGKHPEDDRLFDPSCQPAITQAAAELNWLLSRGYAEKSALKLVGDRHNLTQRQRLAVMRCTCSDDQLKSRRQKQVQPASLSGKSLMLDGYNVITTIETALAGGVVLIARDGSIRDIAGVHGTYRKVHESIPAINLILQYTIQIGISQCQWYLDKPVSNSGRLKNMILEIASQSNCNCHVDVVNNPDDILADADNVVATSDSVILDKCKNWLNLSAQIIEQSIPDAFLVDLCKEPPA